MRRLLLSLPLVVCLAACDATSVADSSTAAPFAGDAYARAERFAVCHLDTDTGDLIRINVPERAYNNHIGHGDTVPGAQVPGMEGYVYDGTCEPVFSWLLEQVSPVATIHSSFPMGGTAEGDVTASVTPVDLQLGPGNASTSGCEAADFAGFPAGNVALIQRGACTFASKVLNAEAAGAVAVVIFNQGNTPERLGVIFGTLSPTQANIPVLGTSYDAGVALAQPGSVAHVVYVAPDLNKTGALALGTGPVPEGVTR